MADDDQRQEPAQTETSQDARLDRLEATQAEQGGKLDQIIAMIKGDGDGKPEAAPAQTGDGPDQVSTIADQVRQAVRDVHAEEAQAAAKGKPDEAPKEKPPRESQSGFRGKLQRAMYGGDPS